eukprot:1182122-Rhodomonas_salina.5
MKGAGESCAPLRACPGTATTKLPGHLTRQKQCRCPGHVNVSVNAHDSWHRRHADGQTETAGNLSRYQCKATRAPQRQRYATWSLTCSYGTSHEGDTSEDRGMADASTGHYTEIAKDDRRVANAVSFKFSGIDSVEPGTSHRRGTAR